MWRTLRQAFLIVIAGAALGLLANTVSPRRIAWITPPKPALKTEALVSLEQARELWGDGTTFFLDARAPADYAAGHIAQALNLPADHFEDHFPKIAPLVTPETPLIIYCDGPDCDLSHKLTEKLKQMGFLQTRVLTNGWTLWRQAGLPTEQGAGL